MHPPSGTVLKLAAALSLIVSSCSGCVSRNTPGDFALVSVQAVDWRDQSEMSGPGVSPVFGMMSNRDLKDMGQSVTGREKPHRSLLKVEFSSSTDLSQFVTKNS